MYHRTKCEKRLYFPDIWNSVITYHWQAGNFLFLKETYKFGNHDPANLCTLYSSSLVWWFHTFASYRKQPIYCYLHSFIWTDDSSNHQRYSETKCSKVSQWLEGIAEDIEGSLIIFIIVMLILAEWCFWWKSVLWGNRATQVKPAAQVKNISKFGCQGHILQGWKKNLNSSLSFGQAAYTFCLPGATFCLS